MASQQTPKALRVGIFQGDRNIEERLLRKRGPVSIGQTLSNTFVVPASSMPKTYTLFSVDAKGNYVLRVSDRMGGRISLGGKEVIDLTRLRNVSAAKKTGDGYEITLSSKARGKVTIGDTRVLFQFVTPPATSVGMLPAALGGGALSGFQTFLGAAILTGVAISALFQLGFLFYVMLQDWPEPEQYNEIPDWYKEEYVEVEEDEEEEEEEEEPEETDADVEGEFAEVEEAPLQPENEKPKPAKKPAPAKTPAEKRARKAAGKKMVGQMFGVEGDDQSIGDAIASDIVGDDTVMSALDGLDAADIGGPSGPSAGLGLGDAGGAGGEASLKEGPGGGGGSDKMIGAGPDTDEPTKRKEIKFKIKENTKIPDSVEPGDKKSFETVFRRKKKQIENCYKRVIQKYGSQNGKLVVMITIGGDGKVMKVKISADSIGKGLGACVEAKIKRWKFPKTGKPVTVAKRWVFGS